MRAAAISAALGAMAMTAATAAPAGGAPVPSPDTGRQDPRAAVAGIAGSQYGPHAGEEARGTAEAARAAARAGVDWKKCPAAEGLPRYVECGTVTVPVDYAKPGGEKIRLTVSRARAKGPAKERKGPLLYNPGGPGANGMVFPMYGKVMGGMWKRLNQAYDLVGYAPRGVGRSAPLSCQDPKEFQRGPHYSPRRPSAADKRKVRREAAAYADGCYKAQGKRLAHYTTPDNARDLDVLRAALGQRKLDFMGASWGTYLGSVYATLFPRHVGRMVLDSVVDPRREKVWYRSNLEQNPAFERRWNDWKRWVAKHHDAYGLGDSAQAVQRSYDEVRSRLDRKAAGGTIGSRELMLAYVNVGYEDQLWPSYAAALSEFRKGDLKALSKIAEPDMKKAKDDENGNAVYNAVQCSDAPWPRDWSRWDRDNTRSTRVAPFNTWENLRMNLPCAYWKGAQSQPVEVGAAYGSLPPVLLLAATRDAATPYGGALETQRRLPGSSLVTEKGAGTHGVAGGNSCADRHLEHYLLDGKTPGERADCAPRHAPKPAKTGRQGT
ncbi:alpha/beta hydrolase [Streptomyces sp. ODS28]|uniref:alpha/beta hydrolase n=1 Tax=Streptomyces sp. ODS28 TaxID=3136688 RepID=UPI0031F065C8